MDLGGGCNVIFLFLSSGVREDQKTKQTRNEVSSPHFVSKRSMMVAPFGSAIGVTRGGVVAYSCDYETADEDEYPDRRSYMNYVDGICTGYKYQCVEFARRFLVSVAGLTFRDVHMAYEIFDITNFCKVSDGSDVPVERCPNGGKTMPVFGSLIIWAPKGYFRHTGHVAVVVEVEKNYVRVAEQNVTDAKWPGGRNYARELTATTSADGSFVLQEELRQAEVIGWVTARARV